jgi:2-dehydro-3-deoxyphosphogluconate aldolase/(4S)-4-hydroxy-2-oxoglutarate aldolase
MTDQTRVRAARADVRRTIEETGVVAVIRMKDADQVQAVVDALAAGGLRAIEITMTVPRAVELIAAVAPSLPEGFVLGAGTVIDADSADAVIRAGAQFVVSPVYKPAVVERCRAHDVAVIPGCFSPTEILSAWEAGADFVKVFPATALGPGYIKDLRGPLPQVRLVPTGGVTRQNAGDWIRAGAAAIGVGTALVDPAAVAARRFDALTAVAREFVEAVRRARGSDPNLRTQNGV